MNTNPPSQEQIEKDAQVSLLTQVITAGRTPEQAVSLMNKHAAQKVARATRMQSIVRSLLGGQDSIAFATAA